MSKHTPGPWEVVALNGFGPFAIRMATPAGTGHPTHYGVGQIGTEANANLIASAPELLETLKAVRFCVEGYIDRCDYSKGNEMLKLLDATVAKAGGQP